MLLNFHWNHIRKLYLFTHHNWILVFDLAKTRYFIVFLLLSWAKSLLKTHFNLIETYTRLNNWYTYITAIETIIISKKNPPKKPLLLCDLSSGNFHFCIYFYLYFSLHYIYLLHFMKYEALLQIKLPSSI